MKTRVLASSLVLCATLLGAAQTEPEKSVASPALAPKGELWPPVYLSAWADYLYMRGRPDNLPFAAAFVKNDEESSSVVREVFHIKPDYEAGFRAGVGYVVPESEWNWEASWSYYQGDSHGTLTLEKDDEYLEPLLLERFNNPVVVNAKGHPGMIYAKWHLLLNTGTVDVGRWFYGKKAFSFRPYIGAKAAWIKQTYTGIHENVVFTSASNFFSPSVRAVRRTSVYGIGLHAGANSTIDLSDGLELYANFSADLLSAQTKTTFEEEIEGKEGPVPNRMKEYSVMPVLEIGAGVKWATDLGRGRYCLSVHAGWEEQLWFSFAKGSYYSENLGLEGIVSGVTLGF